MKPVRVPDLSIVVPTLDEAETIAATLEPLQPWRAQGVEIIVADGASRDATAAIAGPLADVVVAAARGRARQMNAGAAAARGSILVFLHADTRLPANAAGLIRARLAHAHCRWGRFDVQIEGASAALRMVAALMNLRSRSSGIATGDQAIFVRREAFAAVGGFPDIPLMEDVAISRALRRISPPLCLRERVTTSGRRWERHGVWRTILLMWRLRLAYALGADPRRLAQRYGVERTPS
jgi:rSAM/selenodomain-associated transferase 2